MDTDNDLITSSRTVSRYPNDSQRRWVLESNLRFSLWFYRKTC